MHTICKGVFFNDHRQFFPDQLLTQIIRNKALEGKFHNLKNEIHSYNYCYTTISEMYKDLAFSFD